MNQSNFIRRAKHSAFVAFFISIVTLAPTTAALAQSASGTSGMSVAEMSTLIDSLRAMVESLVKQLADLIAVQSSSVSGSEETTVSSVVAPVVPGFVFATIESGKVSPDSVTLLASEQKQLVLNAVDADYVFEIPENGISAAVAAGSKIEIPLGGLGVGVHVFSCGAGCTGSIIVQSEDD